MVLLKIQLSHKITISCGTHDHHLWYQSTKHTIPTATSYACNPTAYLVSFPSKFTILYNEINLLGSKQTYKQDSNQN